MCGQAQNRGGRGKTKTGYMSWGGRLMRIGFTSGQIPSVPMNLPLLKNYSIVGVFRATAGWRFPIAATSPHWRGAQEGRANKLIAAVLVRLRLLTTEMAPG
jgi:hypothetical protein